MRTFEPRDYSLQTATEISNLDKYFQERISVYSYILQDIADDQESPNLFMIIDIKHPTFRFSILKAEQDNGKTNFTVIRTPYNNIQRGAQTSVVDFKGVQNIFQSWTNILLSYEELDNIRIGKFEKTYFDQIYSEFKIIDKNADSEPFEEDRLLGIYQYLNKLKEEIENYPSDNPKKEILLKDIDNLGNKLSILTKNEIVSDISKILAKIKVIGYNLYVLVMDVAKKEAIKTILKEGVRQIQY